MAPTFVAAVLPPPAPPAPPSRDAAAKSDTPFSRQLEQSRQTRAQESPRPAAQDKGASTAPPAPATNGQRPAGPDAAARNQAARTARAPAPRNGGPACEAESATKPDAGPEPTAEVDTADAAAGDANVQDLLALIGAPPAAATTPPGPDQPASLAGAMPPAEPPPAGDIPVRPGLAAPETTVGTAGANATPSMPTEPARVPLQPELRAAREPASNTTAAEPGAWQQAQAAAVLAEAAGSSREVQDARQAEPAAPSDRVPASQGITGPAGLVPHAGKAGDAVAVNFATPATSAEFRAALGAQVSYFARSGVQQAELHLHPAEMGPVSIQIVLDGQQAQVNFGADSAQTRQLIESGMPELAGALRDAGLTLTGGGVSQHAGGQRHGPNGEEPNAGRTPNADSAPDPAAPAQAEHARRSAIRGALGGVDLYA